LEDPSADRTVVTVPPPSLVPPPALADVLFAAALDLTRTLALHEVLECLLDQLQVLVPYDAANVMLCDGPHLLRVRAIRGYETRGLPRTVERASFDARTHPILRQVVEQQRSLLVENTELDPLWQVHPGAEFVKSWMAVPLVYAGKVVGLYCLDKAIAGFFDTHHVRLTEILAPYASVAVEHARMFEQLQESDRRLRRQVAEFETLLDVIPIGIGITRDPGCVRIEPNKFLSRLMGAPQGANVSLTGDALVAARFQFLQGGVPLPIRDLPMQRAATAGAVISDLELDLVCEGRKIATTLNYAAPLIDETGRPRGAIGACLDITARKEAELRVESLAHTDYLTSLPNRLLLMDRLSVAVRQSRRSGKRFALIYLDLDGFKPVNDSLGHASGDRLLQLAAERLTSCVRSTDTVARLGGDEFIVLLTEVSDGANAARIAEKILTALRQPYVLEGSEVSITASAGLSVFPEDGAEAEILLASADAAMYSAKEQGGDTLRLCSGPTAQRFARESNLRRAVKNNELTVHYQPIIGLPHGRILGVEALLRWETAEGGPIPPSEFVPLAEATGSIVPLGYWALHTAVAQVRRWQQRGHPGLLLASNFSARQCQDPALLDNVKRILAGCAFSPHCLELEITESSAMRGGEAALDVLRELRRMGVKLSIDDFGTGHSSLSRLRRLPFDSLKIDKSFVSNISFDADDAAIAAAIVAIGHRLKLEVTAEGVETTEQLALLASQGCDRVQGFLFGRPMPADQCTAALDRAARIPFDVA
jgi:diguanylate cyclase (GGDEF)-like protein